MGVGGFQCFGGDALALAAWGIRGLGAVFVPFFIPHSPLNCDGWGFVAFSCGVNVCHFVFSPFFLHINSVWAGGRIYWLVLVCGFVFIIPGRGFISFFKKRQGSRHACG